MMSAIASELGKNDLSSKMFSSKIVGFDCESLSIPRFLLKRKKKVFTSFFESEQLLLVFPSYTFLEKNCFISVFTIVDPLEQNKNKDP